MPVQDIQTGDASTATGILPIRIQIPATGQLFRFAKTIVNQEPLTLTWTYLAKKTVLLIWSLVLGLILAALFLLRRRIAGLVRSARG